MSSLQEQAVIRKILRGIDKPVILEAGAHCGEEEDWIRDACDSEPLYVMIEPDPRNLKVIHESKWAKSYESRSVRTGARLVLDGAISDKNGVKTFFQSSNERTGDHGSGSLRTPTGHISGMPWIKFAETVDVVCYSLDFIFSKRYQLPKIDLLWADIQGSEADMIRGGQTALKHTRYLFMEVERQELYEGQALEDELIAMLPGWKQVQRFEYNLLMFNPEFAELGS